LIHAFILYDLPVFTRGGIDHNALVVIIITMITSEYPGTAGFAPQATPEASQLDFTTLPHDRLDALVSVSPQINVNMGDVANDASGRLGMRSADEAQPAVFRVGQRVDITFPTGLQEPRPYYVGHDGQLRDFDPASEVPPIEVSTFRQGLAEREAERLAEIRMSSLRILSEEGAEIGATVLRTYDIEPPKRFAKLRGFGRMMLNSLIPTKGPGSHRAVELKQPGANRNSGAGSQGMFVGRHRA
jgi:hypothetical protein